MHHASGQTDDQSNAAEQPTAQPSRQDQDKGTSRNALRGQTAPSSEEPIAPDEPEDLTLAADERLQTTGDAAGLSETRE